MSNVELLACVVLDSVGLTLGSAQASSVMYPVFVRKDHARFRLQTRLHSRRFTSPPVAVFVITRYVSLLERRPIPLHVSSSPQCALGPVPFVNCHNFNKCVRP